MHIVVTLKQVHDPNTLASFMSIGSDGKSLVLHSSTSTVLNSYDANALEEAIRIKERHSGSVTVLSVGDEKGSIAHIRRAIAMGADRGIHVQGPVGIASDSQVIATLLHGALRRIEPADLILCGRQASDTDAGQVPFMLAERLSFSAISPVIAIHSVAENTLVVDRIAEGGLQRFKALFPLVLGISNEINKPRAPGLKGVMLSKKAEVPSWTLTDLGIEAPAPALTLERLVLTERPVLEAEIVGGASAEDAGRALADRLKHEGYF
jgi:electron transfer flavoprotein beta subunit